MVCYLSKCTALREHVSWGAKALSDSFMKDNKQSVQAQPVFTDRCVIYWLSPIPPLHLSGFWQGLHGTLFVISAGPWPWDYGDGGDHAPYQVIWSKTLLCLSSSTVSTTEVKSFSADLYHIFSMSVRQLNLLRSQE